MSKNFIKILSGLFTFSILVGLVFFLKGRQVQTFESHNFFEGESSRSPASQRKRKRVQSSVVLYKPRGNATRAERQALQAALEKYELGTEKKVSNRRVHFAKAKRHQGNEQEMAKTLMDTGAVEFAEPDSFVELSSMPNDPYINNQWHHTRIGSFQAWDTTMGVSEVIVANCDTGVESSHPDLQANLILPGYNTVDRTSNSEPVHTHGTMTAGTTAAVINNSLGVSGVAGKIRILPIRISNETNGGAFFSAMADCITYAADRGAKVVNLSYGGAESHTIDAAAQYLRARGGLLVMSAGNDGTDRSSRPDFSSFIVVGATDSDDNRPSWSNYGLPTDIVAPGVNIFTTAVGETYAYGSGTSFSAPIVSGVAALIYSLNPNLTPDEVESYLFSSARRLGTGGDDLDYGNGLVDAANAVASVSKTSPTPTPTPIPEPTLSIDTASAEVGTFITVSFDGMTNPTSGDWVGLYNPNTSDIPEITYFYTSSCTKSMGPAKSSGSCTFQLPSSAGTYEFRLFPNDQYSPRLASSSAILVTENTAPPTPTPEPTLSLSKTKAKVGTVITVSFDGMTNPTPGDWVGLYNPNTSDIPEITYFYTSSCTKSVGTAKSSGSCKFRLPSNAGTYEFRLFPNDQYSPRLTKSSLIKVINSPLRSEKLMNMGGMGR